MSETYFDAKYYYLRYLAQVAAESYLKVKNAGGAVALLVDKELNDALKLGANRKDFGAGNNGHTQLTDQQITEFLSTYQLIDQWADNPTPIGNSFSAPLKLADGTVVPSNTGFSATLMAVKDKPGEYVFSIRSTEFSDWEKGGDKPRDGSGADMYGITIGGGYAWAQINAMRYYVQWLREQSLLPAGAKVHVTGYSLGGHLALAFEKLYGAGQGGFTLVDGTTFNGPGIGSTTGTVPEMVACYRAQLSAPTLSGVRAASGAPETAEYLWGRTLFDSAKAAEGKPWNSVDIYSDPRHKWAQWVTSWNFQTKWISDLTGLPSGGAGAAYGASVVTPLYGYEVSGNMNMTANAGIHPATVGIPVETQPLVEGNPFRDGDFANGHSITLLGDSLALARTLQMLDPNLSAVTGSGLKC